MKKLAYLLLIAIVICQPGCSKKIVAPSCITARIEEKKNSQGWPGQKVDEYQFKGKIVYAFVDDPNMVADGGVEVLDAECNFICFLGGIAALTTCEGEKFFEVAVFRRTVWQR